MYLRNIDFIELEFDLVCVNRITTITRSRNACSWCIQMLVLLLCLTHRDCDWLIAFLVTYHCFINLNRRMDLFSFIFLKRLLALTHALGLLLDLVSIILLLFGKNVHVKLHSAFGLIFGTFS